MCDPFDFLDEIKKHDLGRRIREFIRIKNDRVHLSNFNHIVFNELNKYLANIEFMEETPICSGDYKTYEECLEKSINTLHKYVTILENNPGIVEQEVNGLGVFSDFWKTHAGQEAYVNELAKKYK